MGRIGIDLARRIGAVDRRIFGNFIEHLGRCIYGGIYEEGSPLSDARGFRRDVNEVLEKAGMEPIPPPQPKNPLLAGLDALVARYGPENFRVTSARGILDDLTAPPEVVALLLAELEADIIRQMTEAGLPLPEGSPLFVGGE